METRHSLECLDVKAMKVSTHDFKAQMIIEPEKKRKRVNSTVSDSPLASTNRRKNVLVPGARVSQVCSLLMDSINSNSVSKFALRRGKGFD